LFDLAVTPEQETMINELRSLVPELREIAVASERDRKPSTKLIDRILDGKYAAPTVDGRIDPLSAVLAAAEYGYADPGIALVIVGSWQAQLLLGDTDANQPIQLTSPMVYEGFGRSPSEFTTTATRDSDGWSLTGRKESVLHPGAAPVSVVVARDAEDGRLGVFRVNGTPDGYTVERDDAAEGKLGLRSAHTGAVRLDRVPLPAAARIDTPDDLALHRKLGLARALIAAVALGSARASLDYAIEWAKKRTAFGKPISTYQGVAFVVADLDTQIETARLLLLETVTSLPRFGDTESLEEAVARAVGRSCAAATAAGREGVNLLGVHGIVTDHPVERWYRASAALSAIDFDPLSVALDVA
jgi:alkylation response protein AidB-like acyl-CoA dehydrogenase